MSLVTNTLEKPDLDDRSYRVIRLANDLEALLIHDPTADKAGAALDVHVGSFQDPTVAGVPLSGLAHFNEHLLFMGSEPFPSENAYSDFLAKNGGHSNAYTASEHTNYYFEVNHEHLAGALDRFAPFFTAPLFSPDCKDREIKAVDSENKKNLQSDMWRLYQLNKFLSNPAYPYHSFLTGNLDTLHDVPLRAGIDVREELIAWYRAHYSANIMKVTVLGRESLDVLQGWVTDRFSAIPNIERASLDYAGAVPFPRAHLLQLIRARPVKDKRSLELLFPVPEQHANWASQPSSYFAHLVGHEGKGSLLYRLKEQGYATGLSAGAQEIGAGAAVFGVEVDLTPKGLQHYEEIVVSVFEYLAMLQQEGPQEWIHAELKTIGDNGFKFRQKSATASTVSDLAGKLQREHIPRNFLLSSSKRREWSAAKTSEFLGHLNATNFRITLVGQELEGLDLKEKWYGTEYAVDPLATDFLAKIAAARPSPHFHLPGPNPFLPTDFSVKKVEVDVPAKRPHLVVASANGGKKQANGSAKSLDSVSSLWFKKDDQFWVPKANILMVFHLPITNASALNASLMSLYLELVEDELDALSYDAYLGGLHYDVSQFRDGFQVKLLGYNEKLPVLMDQILRTIRHFTPRKDRFTIMKEKCERHLKNFGFGVPYNQVGQWSNTLLHEQTWSMDERIAVLPQVTYDTLLGFIPCIFQQASKELLVHGNYEQDEAVVIAHTVNAIFAVPELSESHVTSLRSYLLPDGQTFRYEREIPDPKNVNSVIEYFVQTGLVSNTRVAALSDLLGQVIHEPCFNQLRTKEQLGYVVFSGVKTTRTTLGLRVLVQSERETKYLESRIVNFLNRFADKIAAFTPEEFAKHVDALCAQKLQKKKNLTEEFSSFNHKIMDGFYDFYGNEECVKLLREISQQELLAFYRTTILGDSAAKLVVHLKSQAPPVQPVAKIVTAAVLNYLDGKVEISSKKVDEIIAGADQEFAESLPTLVATIAKNVEGDFAQAELIECIRADLRDPVPVGYPSGEVVANIGQFKSMLGLTRAPQPVVPLAKYTEVCESKL
ncbi:hypothetical protein BABINDRAFT_163886 [Babjeviella inositovora NRRL Y-12698]|uniref:Uncharacterized protein n=1 Tax=Babjeviella inositovora NRRL Y-12698 TaxID=984486 RepID=A0A1E3QH70_9ASCO|nr:uncharacterized protein BABINDRAFT_163886 [Babjeviella inositovora NRRL Y-12698]ODQ76980.1 hypothetical protein BABINDRAFT_163886 [Babjeviella inositovora NRRL Y-12698]